MFTDDFKSESEYILAYSSQETIFTAQIYMIL